MENDAANWLCCRLQTSGDVSNLTRVPGKLRVVFAVKFSISVLLGAGPLPRTLLLLSPRHAVVRRNALLSVAACFFLFLVGGWLVLIHRFPFPHFRFLYSDMTVEKELFQRGTEEEA